MFEDLEGYVFTVITIKNYRDYRYIELGAIVAM
jgi:hypothetical protein